MLTRLSQTTLGGRSYGTRDYGPMAYGTPGQSPVTDLRSTDRAMTIDDVIVRTMGLVLVVIISAAFSWFALRGGALTNLVLAGSFIGGLVIWLVMLFRQVTNPALVVAYSVFQGIILGVVSRIFEQVYSGIVIQAVVGTLAVFLGMAACYKFRVIRATPRFRRWVIGALIGVVALSLFNWLFAVFGHNPGLVYYGPNDHHGALPIIFSLICIGVGALTFILDFDAVEQAVRYGAPERFAWYCAFALVGGLIYLYWQILRLLGYLRN
jgi:uncharacterized YccA/Bax inhibitor family protein